MRLPHIASLSALTMAAMIGCNGGPARLGPPAEDRTPAPPGIDTLAVGYLTRQAPVQVTVTEPGQIEGQSAYVQSVPRGRFNNIYGLAVNTGGVTAATRTVKEDGRVFLRREGEAVVVAGGER